LEPKNRRKDPTQADKVVPKAEPKRPTKRIGASAKIEEKQGQAKVKEGHSKENYFLKKSMHLQEQTGL